MCRVVQTRCNCARCIAGRHYGDIVQVNYCPPRRAVVAEIWTDRQKAASPPPLVCFHPCDKVMWVKLPDPSACHFKNENMVNDSKNKTPQPPSGSLPADNLVKTNAAATPDATAAPVHATTTSSVAPLVPATAAQDQANKIPYGNFSSSIVAAAAAAAVSPVGVYGSINDLTVDSPNPPTGPKSLTANGRTRLPNSRPSSVPAPEAKPAPDAAPRRNPGKISLRPEWREDEMMKMLLLLSKGLKYKEIAQVSLALAPVLSLPVFGYY